MNKTQLKAEAIKNFRDEFVGDNKLVTNESSDRYILEAHISSLIDTTIERCEEEMKVTGDTSDGYHTFNELYEFRKVFNAVLFNEWAKQHKYDVHKSKRHNDGEECFGGGWFIVMAQLPTGQISNHYELKDWDLFQVPEVSTAAKWDGHTAQDVVKRLISLTSPTEEGKEKV